MGSIPELVIEPYDYREAPGIFRVSEHYCFIGEEVRNMSGLCGFTVMGLPKGHKLSIRQSSEDPSRIRN